MDLNEYFGADGKPVDLKAENRWDAIDELVDHLVSAQKIAARHREAIIESVKKREKSMTTGIGFGVGIPHASSELVSDVVGIIGRSRKGIQFDTLDGNPVKIVLLFLVPKGQFQTHLHTLTNISKLLHQRLRDHGDEW